MTRSELTTIERTTTIDASAGDICAILADLTNVPEYCPEASVTPAETGIDVVYTINVPGSPSRPSLPITVFVTGEELPTRLTLALVGAVEGTVEWSLHPTGESTRVTATVSYTVNTPLFRETAGGYDWAGVEPQSAVVATMTTTVEESLFNLKELCEQHQK